MSRRLGHYTVLARGIAPGRIAIAVDSAGGGLAVVSRIKATLARLGIRNFKPTLRKASEYLATGHAAAAKALAELQRDMARLGCWGLYQPDQRDRGRSSETTRAAA
jgi:hypothetical protein